MLDLTFGRALHLWESFKSETITRLHSRNGHCFHCSQVWVERNYRALSVTIVLGFVTIRWQCVSEVERTSWASVHNLKIESRIWDFGVIWLGDSSCEPLVSLLSWVCVQYSASNSLTADPSVVTGVVLCDRLPTERLALVWRDCTALHCCHRLVFSDRLFPDLKH